MEVTDKLSGQNRRSFLKNLSLLGIAGALLPKNMFAQTPPANSRVIIVSDTQATSGTTISTPVVQTMINSGICALAQLGDVGEAWKALLPGVSAASRIAIKVNCINSSLSSHPQAANAIAASLQQMNFGGTFLPANNIIIYDRTRSELQNAGYTINSSTTGVRCIGTDMTGIGYSTQNYSVNGQTQKISKVVTEMCDYLINLAVLKNHSMSGITLCLKNHYGTCNNPGNLHNTYCNPYIPALNALDPIKAKQKVFIIDALYGIRSGGPGGAPQFVANKFILSTDVVACDYQGRKLLQENGCTTTSTATHVDTAATTYQLGTNNPAQMDVITVQNPSAKAVALTAPNGGEIWTSGTTQLIKWTSQNIPQLKIELSTDSGASWQVIEAAAPAAAGQYEWTVPNSPSQRCKIRLTDTSDSSKKDESDSYFSIVAAPMIALLSPNGGEEIFAGQTFPVQWNAVNMQDIKIEYSVNAGQSWLLIEPAVPSLSGRYDWSVPATPSEQCKVKLSDAGSGTVFDQSDSVFTIKIPSNIREATRKEGYELYQCYPNPFNGQTTVRFALPEAGMVKIDIINAEGRSVDTVLSGHYGAGEHSLFVNASSLSSGIYFIRLRAERVTLLRKTILIK
jgi:uncharacterized protein (DUF362 family)